MNELLTSWGAAGVVGLLLGVASGLHCAAMCGAFALHAAGSGGAAARSGRVAAWTAGRTTTYVALGLLVARIGRAALDALAAGRSALLLVAGAALAAWGLRLALAALGRPLPRVSFPGAGRLTAAWSAAVGPLRDNARGPYAFGLVNGLLPCGMTATALLAAASRADALGSAALMAGFGAATLPVLWLASCAGPWASRAWTRPALRVAVGLLVVVLGAWFSTHAVRSWPSGTSDVVGAPCPLCPPGSP